MSFAARVGALFFAWQTFCVSSERFTNDSAPPVHRVRVGTTLLVLVPKESCQSLWIGKAKICSELGGKYLDSNGMFCAVPGHYTHLFSKLPDDTVWIGMSEVCSKLGGKLFGRGGIECAVPGQYTQLSGRQDELDRGYLDISYVCAALGGHSFGYNNVFCAVPGQYTQLSSMLPGAYNYEGMAHICNELGGTAFGSHGIFCALRGQYTQLTSKHPGDAIWNGMPLECARLGGRVFGKNDIFCVVRGEYTQLSSSPSTMSAVCTELGGISFGRNGIYCAVPGHYSQLTVKLKHDNWEHSFWTSTTCSELGGKAFGSNGIFCAVPGQYVQLISGAGSFEPSVHKTANTCSELRGKAFGDSSRFCAVQCPTYAFVPALPIKAHELRAYAHGDETPRFGESPRFGAKGKSRDFTISFHSPQFVHGRPQLEFGQQVVAHRAIVNPSGNVDFCTAEPPLPDGLEMEGSTCTIHGKSESKLDHYTFSRHKITAQRETTREILIASTQVEIVLVGDGTGRGSSPIKKDHKKLPWTTFDTNGDVMLDIDELQVMYGQVSKEQLLSAVKQADKNGNGMIDFEDFQEFQDIMEVIVSKWQIQRGDRDASLLHFVCINTQTGKQGKCADSKEEAVSKAIACLN